LKFLIFNQLTNFKLISNFEFQIKNSVFRPFNKLPLSKERSSTQAL
jgi:hypothetical protein